MGISYLNCLSFLKFVNDIEKKLQKDYLALFFSVYLIEKSIEPVEPNP